MRLKSRFIFILQLDRLGLRGAMPTRNVSSKNHVSQAKRRRSTSEEAGNEKRKQTSARRDSGPFKVSLDEGAVNARLQATCHAVTINRRNDNILVEDYLCDLL